MRKISLLILIVILVVVFHKYFLSGPLVWGDAPYLYKEGLKELINVPQAWISRGNTLGGINLFLWIYPVMVVYGILGTFLHLNNDLILRILFYFPSVIFGFIGGYFLIKNFKLSKTVSFFAISIYLVNTYYLLIIDGGQVGVVLAYGLFPLVLYVLERVKEKATLKSFFLAFGASFVLTVVDFRISVICIFTSFLFNLFERKKVKPLILILICLVGLSAYWVVPILNLSIGRISTDVTALQTTSLLNSLFLFAPNWPSNQFGNIVPPYFYFFLVPILIFLPLFIIKQKKIIWLSVIFLFFAFLAKGTTPPFGFLYSTFVNTRIGSVYRDSTKFFIPLMLIGGILIGVAIEELAKRIKFVRVFAFIFMLLLVWQAIFGRLNGVLGKNPDLSDYQKIYHLISGDNSDFFRSAWFNEISPFSYHTQEKQALSASELINFRPFASMNVGDGDKFNFVNNPEYLDWFKLIGIKYLIFNENPRVTKLNESDQKDWDRLNNLIEKDKRLQKLNIGTNISVYENQNILPNKFFVDKSFVVVGGDDIYQKFQSISKIFSVSNQGFIFPEDGKVDMEKLQYVASTSAVLIFNHKTIDDLKMSFLQKNFVSPGQSVGTQWAIRKSSEYLNWKYELLTKEVDTHEFDYGKGIAFSTQAGEKISFSLNIPEDGKYFLIIRSMTDGQSALKENFGGNINLISLKTLNNFEWNEEGPINLTKGDKILTLENTGGLQVINTVGLVNVDEMKKAAQLSQNFLGFFEHYDISDVKIKSILEKDKWRTFDPNDISHSGWVIYSDSFNNNFVGSYPMYSMINGFYVDKNTKDFKITFLGDEYIRWGIYWSGISVIVIVIITLWTLRREKHQ